MNILFDALFFIVPLLVLLIFIFVFVLMFSPKLRGNFMSNQVKATRYMLDESRDDLTHMGSTVGNVKVQTRKNILDQNEDNLKDMAIREANIIKEPIETVTRAIKDGLQKNVMYCKHCGEAIDPDSIYCKHCGKKQS